MDRQTSVVGVALFLAFGGLYLYTLAPSVMPGDYAEFQMCAAILGVPHPTGYPLYILLGKLFTLLPFGDVAFRVNLSSAVYMAGATAVLYAVCVRLLTYMGRDAWRPFAAVGAVFFALSPTVWSMALVARSYALNALLVACVVYALVSWRHTRRAGWFYASCLLIGLSMVHHGTTYLLLPAYLLYLFILDFRFWTVERDKSKIQNPKSKIIPLGVLAFLLGYSPMLFLVYRFVYGAPYFWGDPTTWKDFFSMLTGGPFHGQVMAFGWDAQLDRLTFGLGELSKQYTPLGILVGVVGLVVLWHCLRAEAWLLTLMLAGNFLFAMNYALVGYLYFIPTYLIWGVLSGIGLAWIGGFAANLPPLLRWNVTTFQRFNVPTQWGLAAVVVAFAVTALLTRYSGVSMRHQTAVRDEALALLNAAPQGASLYMDWEDVSVIRFYRLVYGVRPDLTLHTGDPADWAQWIYCDVTNGVPAYVGKFAGAVPSVVGRDFALEAVPMGWRVLKVVNGERYEAPPCGACATCR